MELPDVAGWMIILITSMLFALLIACLHLAFYGSEDRNRHDLYAALINGEEPPPARVHWLPLRYAMGAGSHGAAFSAGLMALDAYSHVSVVCVSMLLWGPWLAGGIVIGAAHWLRVQGAQREIVGYRRGDLLKEFDDTSDRTSGGPTRRTPR